MYQHVLVPTDGSEGTRAAVERAVDLANRYDAALHTLYVVDTTVGPDPAVSGTFEALEAAGRDAIEAVIEFASDRGVETVEASVGRGPPHRAILDYVDEQDVDLVVMGTHGRTGAERYLLGSVTEKVLRLSRVPVLTVPLPEQTSEGDG
jgi:nucleotide-binding universal stress UspA family protein